MRVPALLFDLDGTLVDSVYQYVLAWREAQAEGVVGSRLRIRLPRSKNLTSGPRFLHRS